MNITSKTHKLHGYHYQSLDKKKVFSKPYKPTKNIGNFYLK